MSTAQLDHPLPCDVVDLHDGRRLPLSHGTTVSQDRISAPRILAVEARTSRPGSTRS
ncbi:hypothetical protein [Streptomyces sp. NPDC001787]|uniref:hypothetical protein n=1 Tax=Streptomyces sp. NPDC001787 TaxID=3154523 RepID=UPI0033178111